MTSSFTYYTEFIDPADIEVPYIEPEKGSLWDEFINDDGSEIDNNFAETLWNCLQDASAEVDQIYEEVVGNSVIEKPYEERRKVFEEYFCKLHSITNGDVVNTSPSHLDCLIFDVANSEKVSLFLCYGIYCIDKGLRAYFLDHKEISSKALCYGVYAIQSALGMKYMDYASIRALSSNSSRAGKARAKSDDRHVKLNLILNEYKTRELNGYDFNLSGRLTKFYDEMSDTHEVAFGSVKNRIEKYRRDQKQSS